MSARAASFRPLNKCGAGIRNGTGNRVQLRKAPNSLKVPKFFS